MIIFRMLCLKILIHVLLSYFFATLIDGFVVIPTTLKSTTSKHCRFQQSRNFIPFIKSQVSYSSGRSHRKILFISSSQYVSSIVLLKASTSSSSDSWELLEIDFSSPYLWDQYYRDNPIESSTLEWHKSIPFSIIGDYCLTSIVDESISNKDKTYQCLMVGCGTSFLPEHVIDLARKKQQELQITLLDSSKSCMDTLQRRYVNYTQYSNHLTYVVGSALELEKLFCNNERNNKKFNVILDKGLMDALLCNDNWETTVTTLLQQSILVLKQQQQQEEVSTGISASNSASSRYILVSYRLSTTTQQTLIQIGQSIGFKWKFNCTGSNDRVWISVAHIVNN
jgi:hypothetical protein